MSRSYKRYPCWSAPNSKAGVHSYVHDIKKIANRKARRPWYWDTPSGNAYRKITDPWDIRDYVYVMYTKTEVMDAIKEAIEDIKKTKNSKYKEYYKKRCLMYYYYSK